MSASATLAYWRERFILTPDGPETETPSSALQPVSTSTGEAAVLKVARADYEELGGTLMAAYAGRGAARVLAGEGPAVVLERLSAEPSLQAMAERGLDDQATQAVCAVVEQLHRTPPPDGLSLPTLRDRFLSLRAAAERGRAFADAWAVAELLLAEPADVRLLHGDIHHGNILWSPAQGWLAIDPQPLVGERTYDYANLLKNPSATVMLQPGRLRRTAEVIATRADLPLDRLLAFGQAHAALSAAWALEDGFPDPAPVLAVSEIAAQERR